MLNMTNDGMDGRRGMGLENSENSEVARNPWLKFYTRNSCCNTKYLNSRLAPYVILI